MNQYEKVRQRLKCEGFIQSLLPQVKRKRETFPFTKYYGSKITLTCKLVSQAHPKGYTLHEAFLIPSVKQISPVRENLHTYTLLGESSSFTSLYTIFCLYSRYSD